MTEVKFDRPLSILRSIKDPSVPKKKQVLPERDVQFGFEIQSFSVRAACTKRTKGTEGVMGGVGV